MSSAVRYKTGNTKILSITAKGLGGKSISGNYSCIIRAGRKFL